MQPQARPLIFFDVLGTLVYNPFFREIPAFFGLTHAELLRRKHPTSWIDFEMGRMSETEYFARFFSDGSRFDEDAFRTCVADAYRWIDGMESCLAEVQGAGNEVHTLSNYPVWYQTIEERLRLSRYLRWTFVSCETGVRKPARNAFLLAARQLGRLPAQCLLIDDCMQNCFAAEEAGMPAIQFFDACQLRHELVCRGLIPFLISTRPHCGSDHKFEYRRRDPQGPRLPLPQVERFDVAEVCIDRYRGELFFFSARRFESSRNREYPSLPQTPETSIYRCRGSSGRR